MGGRSRKAWLLRRGVIAAAVVAGLATALGTANAMTQPDPDVSTKIVGGNRAEANEFPWMVRLSMGCGGALFEQDIVLTAAHCVTDFGNGPETTITATAGTVDLQDPNRIVVRSTSITIAPDLVFQSSNTSFALVNDWALIKLQRAIDLPTLPIAENADNDKGRFDIMGWGASAEGGGQKRFLRKAEVPSVTDATCEQNYEAAGFVYDANAHLCAGFLTKEIDSCQGDSGGPMVRDLGNGRFVQVGIVSFGNGCARADFPGVYTQVSSFADDIKAAAARL
ncbi:trypsin [Virgisporangium aliadipatigenens]|uniref:Trypsin n=1 Tax=Virgisporangium aliadipatigenens TaxID=741659 RepID=A0A8J3YMK0_9ACTN|nr:serine protease [Virgisporangium aliadipatigenens]GIJ48274.1 trypsin [Virgisporangium aliadipatigenens]